MLWHGLSTPCWPAQVCAGFPGLTALSLTLTDPEHLQALQSGMPVHKLWLDWAVMSDFADEQLARALRSLPAAFRQRITDLQLPRGAQEAVRTVSG